ncbi:LIPS lipase, partial [Sakesphorus luctuosus]|nr:LIPS lipase [Sakesphorus luctuosus]
QPLLSTLQTLSQDNLCWFSARPSPTSGRFCSAFSSLLAQSRRLGPSLRHLLRAAPSFDLDEATPGNGYRSLCQ